MSLSVYLKVRKFTSYDMMAFSEESEEVFHANITHNLNKMAQAAGVYYHLWRPEEIEITKAHELIEPLQDAYHKLIKDKNYYDRYNPSNGWGTWGGLVTFIKKYLDACKEYPNAEIEVSR